MPDDKLCVRASGARPSPEEKSFSTMNHGEINCATDEPEIIHVRVWRLLIYLLRAKNCFSSFSKIKNSQMFHHSNTPRRVG
jgi:hypothetical protein